MKRLTGFLIGGAMLAPGMVLAAGDLSYTYVEADYLNLSIDPFDEEEDVLEDFDDGDGWAIRGSFALTPNIFILGGYSEVDADASFVEEGTPLFTSDRDVETFTIGGGFNIPILEDSAYQIDAFARGAYQDVDFGDFDFGSGSEDEDLEDFLDDLNEDSTDGLFVDAGLRSQVLQWLELSAGARYTDIGGADSVSFVGGALLEISPIFGVNLDVNIGDDISEVMLGLRLSLDWNAFNFNR